MLVQSALKLILQLPDTSAAETDASRTGRLHSAKRILDIEKPSVTI
jgi:hypothetical protein